MSFAAVILIITAIVCTRAWHKHSRQYRRAREYEASVKVSSSSSPVTMSSMRRLINIHRSIILMRKQEKHSPQVYFIYSNLAMASEDQEKPPEERAPPVIPKDAKSSGVILNPCVFYV
ncbi:hypothetical protein AB205_0064970 [Aquarana catesbeiana]|uniref:Uncharacterized protein n=1 Tax=Aquarana catesbeiana TaxID=8400 RepID=A0A2G9RL58_AQUCT|nr:hypothetical protein AB205_0064970 [Aquarana catesbeiana]